jgi:hypothetical protein
MGQFATYEEGVSSLLVVHDQGVELPADSALRGPGFVSTGQHITGVFGITTDHPPLPTAGALGSGWGSGEEGQGEDREEEEEEEEDEQDE